MITDCKHYALFVGGLNPYCNGCTSMMTLFDDDQEGPQVSQSLL